MKIPTIFGLQVKLRDEHTSFDKSFYVWSNESNDKGSLDSSILLILWI